MSRKSIPAFLKSTQFMGQPGKPIEPATKYNSFLYIALNEENKPKIGFTIGDRKLGKDYNFVWSWSLPKPIAIESKVKSQLKEFSEKSNEEIIVDGIKYKTETFNIDLFTLIHIVRLNVLVMSAWMEYIPFTKDMRYLYERLNRRDFNYIKCLDEEYLMPDEYEKKAYANISDFDFIRKDDRILRKKDINKDTNPDTYDIITPSNVLDVDQLYAFLQLNLKRLNITTQVMIYPRETFVSVEPLRKEGDFYVVEYEGTAMYVDENTLDDKQKKNLDNHLNKEIKEIKKDETDKIEKTKIVPYDWIFTGPRFVNSFEYWIARQKNYENKNIKDYVKDKQPKDLKKRFDNDENIYLRVLWEMENTAPKWYYGLIVAIDKDEVTLWNGELKENEEQDKEDEEDEEQEKTNKLDTWSQSLDGIWYEPKPIELDIMQFKKPTRELYEKIKDKTDLDQNKIEELEQNQIINVDED